MKLYLLIALILGGLIVFFVMKSCEPEDDNLVQVLQDSLKTEHKLRELAELSNIDLFKKIDSLELNKNLLKKQIIYHWIINGCHERQNKLCAYFKIMEITEQIKQKIKEHALSKPTEEVCGLILRGGEVIECKNRASDFEVHFIIAKGDIKKALEELFKIKIIKINTLILPSGKKKAYVKLSPETPAIDIATQLGLI